MDFVLHSHTNWSAFAVRRPDHPARAVQKQQQLPKWGQVATIVDRLRTSSCAVIGASSALKECHALRTACDHDIVIHVNDHPAVLQTCSRVDVQFVNQHACRLKRVFTLFWWNRFRLTTMAHSGGQRECAVQPQLFRFRTEWSAKTLRQQPTNVWLTSFELNDAADSHLRRCCASTGGVAVEFALRACRYVTLFGLGGVNLTHVDSDARMHHAHNMKSEAQYLRKLVKARRVEARCMWSF